MELLEIFKWWLVFFFGGLIFLPFTFFFFSKFKDKGYIFSKVIAIAFISYTVFLVSWLKLLPFSFFEILLVSAIFILINIWVAKKINFINVLRQNIKLIIFEELIFVAGILLWSFVRGNLPDINGLEKFMDFGFVNSILRSSYFPPIDMWYPPFPINYYYFGHLVTAIIIKASIVPSAIGYNLMLATLFSFTFTGVFSLVMNLFDTIKPSLKSVLTGILSAALVTFGGNLTTIYAFFKAYMPMDQPVPFWQLPFLPFSFPNDYWYPNATRFIQYTIHEFPIYSFVVSDLHGHVLDIPFVLLTMGVLFSMFVNFKKNLRSKHLELLNFVLIGFLLAIMYMTNAWDGPIYFLLFVMISIFMLYKQNKFLQNLIFRSAIVFASFFVFSLPFSINFKPFVSGIGILCAPEFITSLNKLGPFLFEADHCQRSPLWQLVILYGFFYFFVISFIIFLRYKKREIKISDKFVSLLIIISTLLLIVPEFIYVKDIYPMHYRANTMFKLSYEAFIMLSLSSGYIIFRIISFVKNKRLILLFFVPSFILLYMVLSYSVFAINSFYDNLKDYKGLDGTVYLERTRTNDYKIINWLNSNIKGQPIILEANGDSYTDYDRISVNTGLPTVVGWPVHEWLWRGSYEIVSPRIEDVRILYTTQKIEEAKKLLRKYKIEYVIISSLEREKYPDLLEDKFNKLGSIVFRSEESKIYKINF